MNAVICMIKGLLFDFDDTIGNRVQYSYQAYAYLLDSYCSFDDPYEREAVLQDCMLWDMKGNFSKEFVLENLRKKYHLSLPIQSLWSWWVENQYRFTCPLDDAKMVLETLHAKYQLALVTNGNDQAQRNKVAQIGFEKYFDVIVTSEQASTQCLCIGFRKTPFEKRRSDICGGYLFYGYYWCPSFWYGCHLVELAIDAVFFNGY